MEAAHNLQWRTSARAVAKLNNLWLILVCVVYAIWSVLILDVELKIYFTDCKVEISQSPSFHDIWLTIYSLATSTFIYSAAIVLVEVFALKRLYNAIDLETTIHEAFRHSVCWLLVQLIVILYRAVFLYSSGLIWVWSLELCVRLGSFFVVFKYTKELKEVIEVHKTEIPFYRIGGTRF